VRSPSAVPVTCELPPDGAWEVAGAALLTGVADDGAGVYVGTAEDAGTTEAAETEAAEEGTATGVDVTGLGA
jgi:F0F1-type ATP synthase membrane subunit c/vacuolar-type H+-ATPase subunit K